MTRSTPTAINRMIGDLRAALRKQPEGAAFIGVVTILDESTPITIGSVGATPSHYVALAGMAMQRAIEKMTAMKEPPRDLIAKIHAALAALDLYDEGAPDA